MSLKEPGYWPTMIQEKGLRNMDIPKRSQLGWKAVVVIGFVISAVFFSRQFRNSDARHGQDYVKIINILHSKRTDEEKLQFLKSCNVNSYLLEAGVTPLETMVIENDIDSIVVLLRAGADPFRRACGHSAFDTAIELNRGDVLKMFETKQTRYSASHVGEAGGYKREGITNGP